MMQKILITLLLVAVGGCSLWAQRTDTRLAPVQSTLKQVARLELPTLDNAALLEEELALREKGRAPYFAERIDVDVSPNTHGTWEELPGGDLVWRLRIPSGGAKSINLGFDQFYMPGKASLILYSPDYEVIQGPFSRMDNDTHGELWTPIIPGDELVVELKIAPQDVPFFQLHLTAVNHDFVGFIEMSEALSGSCNLDVICDTEDGWDIINGYRDIIQSVGAIGFGGNRFCTGFLVNNARQDCTPYFMTAAHCGINSGNAASLVVYWNYESLSCRQPFSPASGGNGNGPLNDFNTGAIWRATYGGSGANPPITLGDATLVELDDPVSPTADAFFAGWDVSGALTYDTVIVVHHPDEGEKRISFEFDQVTVTNYFNGSPNADGPSVRVADWDIGTTEPGSSGAPLFSSEKRVIGLLSGGAAACGNNDPDWFGRLAVSWEGGGTDATSLRPWLDPDNTGITQLDGRAQLLCTFFVLADQPSQSLCAPETATFQVDISENFTGPVMISLDGLPTGLTATFDDTTVDPGDATQLVISTTDQVPTGVYSFTLNATDGVNAAEQELELKISEGLPLSPVLSTPQNNASNQSTVLSLIWADSPTANDYDVQLSNDEAFTDIVEEWTDITTTSVLTPSLAEGLTYYWRVRAHNVCGEGVWAPAYSFTTGQIACEELMALDVPVPISTGPTGTYMSEIVITQPGIISSLTVFDLDIAHTYVGDLDVTLVSPSGTSVVLFSTPGGGNCFGDDVFLAFSDDAANTAADLASTCNNSPAIEGLYQPLGSLSDFAGEDAVGTWTLVVNDNAFQDGGAINGWSLDVCATIPSEVSLIASVNAVEACAGTTTGFALSLGTGFSSNAINLSVSGLPADAILNFEENPTAPGSTVDVTVGGISTPGTYTATFVANDGTDMAETTVDVIILPVLATPDLQVPMDNELDVTTATGLFWQNIGVATGYIVVVSTNPDLSDPFIEANPTASSFAIDGLENNTVYYWSVQAQGTCGPSDFAEVFSFTTIPDLNFMASNTELSGCTTDEINVVFAVGEGLGDELNVMVNSNPTATFAIVESFNVETRELSLTLGDLFVNTPGTYNVTVNVSGEGYSNSEILVVSILETPPLPSLGEPMTGEEVVNADGVITFSWTGSASADNYIIEVATDDAFNNIVASETVTATTVDISVPEPNQYFWRVTAANDCGDAVTAGSNFTYIMTSVQEIAGVTLEVLPNPTTGPLQLRLSGTLPGELMVEGFAANGQRLQAWRIPAVAGTHQLDISNWPAGVYTFRISNGQAQITERIILTR